MSSHDLRCQPAYEHVYKLFYPPQVDMCVYTRKDLRGPKFHLSLAE